MFFTKIGDHAATPRRMRPSSRWWRASLAAALVFLLLQLPKQAFANHVENVVFPGAGDSANVALRATLYRPRGDGPFPALVLLHGCDGVIDLYHKWAGRFWQMGYVALIVDSFKPRGLGAGCAEDHGDRNGLRVDDAYGALAYLAKRADVDPARIALVGWGEGGDAALRTVGLDPAQRPARPVGLRFRAAAAFYPGCDIAGGFEAPVLIMMGDADRWTPVAPCADMVRNARRIAASAAVALQVYPGATHLFDDDFPTNAWLLAEQARSDPEIEVVPGGYTFLGYFIRYDREAHMDAIVRLAVFFEEIMGPARPKGAAPE